MRNTAWTLGVAIVVGTSSRVHAQDPAPTDTPGASAEVARTSALEEAIRSFQLSGEVEILATWDPRHSRARGDLDLRGPDADADRVSLQNAELLADRPVTDGRAFGARVRLCAGEVSRFASLDPDADPGATVDVREAFLTWRVPGAPLERTDLSVGKFRSPLGFESLENSENSVVTRNPISCFATPATLFGIRAALPWSDRVTTNLYVTNGWDDRTISDEGRTVIVHAVLGRFEDTLASQVQFAASYGALTGPGVRKGDKRRFFEVIWDGRLAEGTDFAVDAVVGDSPDRSWRGVAAYVKHAVTKDVSLAARVGTYDDDVLAPRGARVSDVSLVVAFQALETTTLSIEYRHDWSADDVFHSRTGAPSGEQDTLTWSVVVRF